MCEDPHVLAPFGLGNSLMAACFWFPSFFARFALHPGWPVEPKKSQNGRMSSKGKYPCQGRSHEKKKIKRMPIQAHRLNFRNGKARNSESVAVV